MFGIGWACWPATTPVVAVAASLVSLLATSGATGDGARFAFFTEFVVLPVLFGAVLAGRARWRWPIAVLLAGAAASISLRAGPGPVRWVIAISMLVLLGAAATAVVYIRLRDHERRTSVELARQNERLELARELHDVVGHHVTGIVVLAQASRFTTAGRDAGAGNPDIDRTLAQIEAAGLETLTSVRRLVGLLRTEPSPSFSATLADIVQLVDDLRRTHPDIDFNIDTAVRSLWVPPEHAAAIHRLVQEATTNVRKHGDPDAPVAFDLRRTDDSLVMTVDNGSLGERSSSGYGLTGMQERVERLGGLFSAGVAGPGRWAIRASLPMFDIEQR